MLLQICIRDWDARPKDDKTGLKRRAKKTSSNIVSITISIGVADNQSANKPEEVIKMADKVLYKAKKNGRNRTEM